MSESDLGFAWIECKNTVDLLSRVLFDDDKVGMSVCVLGCHSKVTRDRNGYYNCVDLAFEATKVLTSQAESRGVSTRDHARC